MAQELPSVLSAPHLRQIASWIRDELDPHVAREGPMALDPNDVLTIHSVLLALHNFRVPLKTLRLSRVHIAVTEMCGKATRWPRKLVDEADNVVESWEKQFGKVKKIRVPLFEDGGRLWGICDPSDTTQEALLTKFEFCDSKSVDVKRAHRHGHLDFTPGEWWISSMFAFREGIIDLRCANGGICYNSQGAYAVVIRGDDEARANSPKSFTYRCRPQDRGRFRLTSADHRSRHVIRVLRSHGMTSSWAPRVGLRYDGLHKVVRWTCRPVPDTDSEDGHRLQYDVHFEYIEEYPMPIILRRPIAEECDDFHEYQRVTREEREAEKAGGEALAVRRARKAQTDIICRLPSTPSSPDISSSPVGSLLSIRAPKMNIMNIKAEIEAANELAGYGSSFGSVSRNMSEASGFSRKAGSPLGSPRPEEFESLVRVRSRDSDKKLQRILGTGELPVPIPLQARKTFEGKKTTST